MSKQLKYDKINLFSKSSISTPVSKSISSISVNSSSFKKRKNKENIDSHTSDDASSNSLDSRRKSNDHEKFDSIILMSIFKQIDIILDVKLNLMN